MDSNSSFFRDGTIYQSLATADATVAQMLGLKTDTLSAASAAAISAALASTSASNASTSATSAAASLAAMIPSNITLTQGGTGAVPISLDALLRPTITPEQFGAVPGFDATLAIQRAVNYAKGLTNGGTVKLLNLKYSTSAPIVINSNAVSIIGTTSANSRGTQIDFTPAASGQAAISVAAGAAMVSDITIAGIAFTSPDTTTYKKAIAFTDGSFVTIRDVFISGGDGGAWRGGISRSITGAVASPSGEIRLTVANAATDWQDGTAVAISGVVGTTEANTGWPIVVSGGSTIDLKGSVFTNAYTSGGTITASSIGVHLSGRELFILDHVSIVANLALRISKNPNYAPCSLDQSTFFDTTFVSTGTNPIVMADDGVILASTLFTGAQSWGGGKDGFVWRDRTSAAISEQVRFENVRQEQASVLGGTHFVVKPNQTLYSLQIVNPLMAERDGIIARNVGNLEISGAHHLGVASTKVLDIDASVLNTSILSSYWIAGTTASIAGQTLVLSGGKNPSTGPLPSFAVYASTSASPVGFLNGNVTGNLTGNVTGNVTGSLNGPVTGNVTGDLTGNVTGNVTGLVNGATVNNTAWTSYTPTLTNAAGGAIGTGNTLTGFYKQIGKTVLLRVRVVIGASGMGTATQIGFSVPVTPVSGVNMPLAGYSSLGVGWTGALNGAGTGWALMTNSSTGAGPANSTTYDFNGSYEAA